MATPNHTLTLMRECAPWTIAGTVEIWTSATLPLAAMTAAYMAIVGIALLRRM